MAGIKTSIRKVMQDGKNTSNKNYVEYKSEEVIQEIDNLIEKTISRFTIEVPNVLNMYDSNRISKEEVDKIIKTYIQQEIDINCEHITQYHTDEVFKGFSKVIWGYDILEELINNEDISDINILAYDNIRIKEKGKRKKSEVKFRNDSSYKRFVSHVGIKNRRSISENNAVRWFVDSKSSERFRLRFNVTISPVTSDGKIYLSIRKIPKFKYGFDKLIEYGMLTEKQRDYIVGRASNGHGIIIGGKGGSGKTILLNEIIDYLPHDKRYDVIQDNDELFTNKHPDMMFHTTVEPQGDSKLEYSAGLLGKNGLLEDLDGFIIGEVKGKEAAHLGHMTYTGHQAMCTTHAESARDAHYKIADYAREESGEEPEKYVLKLKSLDTVIYMNNFKIIEIVEVEGIENGKLKFVNPNV